MTSGVGTKTHVSAHLDFGGSFQAAFSVRLFVVVVVVVAILALHS